MLFSISGLTVEDTRGIERVKDLSLEVRRGEILGIAGIDGNGQHELVEAIMNMVPSKSGSIRVRDTEIQNRTPSDTLAAGISTIPEDRHKHGLVLDFSVAENFVIENFRQEPYSRKGVLNLKAIRSHATELIEKFDVRPAGCENNAARGLSGGNQQKLIIAREVFNDPMCSLPCSPPVDWMSAPSSMYTRRWSKPGIRARPFCSSRWNWMRSWMCPTALQLFMMERLWIPSTQKAPMKTTSAF